MNRRFTLLEVITAVALTAVVASVLFSVFYIGFRSREHVRQTLAPAERAAVALRQLHWDLESAMPPTGILAGPFHGTEGGEADAVYDSTETILRFYTVNQDALGGGHGIRRVQYALVSSGHGLSLVRTITDDLLSPVIPPPLEELVCSGVLRLDLAYFDGVRWDTSWDSIARGDRLPAVILVDLTIRGSFGEDAPESGSEAVYRARRKLALPAAGYY